MEKGIELTIIVTIAVIMGEFAYANIPKLDSGKMPPYLKKP